MNIRNIVLAAAIAVTGAANAQQFVISLVSGGTQTGNLIKLTGSQFTVKVSIEVGSTPFTAATINTALAYAQAGTPVTGPLTFVSGTKLAPAQFSTDAALFQSRAAALSSASNYSTAAGLLPQVIYSSFGVPPATPPTIVTLSGTVDVATYTFNSSIAQGQTWGDAANESGLFLAAQTGSTTPSLGASGTTGKRFGSQKYQIQAVPEPATMLVLGAGLAALARRRKNA